MEYLKFNIVIIGVSCFDGMASSMRVKNLLGQSASRREVQLHNLIYENDKKGLKDQKGVVSGIAYEVIKFRSSNVFSLFTLWKRGMSFLRRNKSAKAKNIIYNYEYVDIKNIVPLLYARIIGYKIILDIVEDNALYTYFPSLKNKLKIASSKFLLKRTSNFAHAVLTISYHLKDLMVKQCKGKIPVELIPITVNLDHFQNTSYKPSEKIKIFYGGSFGAKDGLVYLIKAFDHIASQSPTIELILTGRASKEDYKKLMQYIGNSAAKDRIVLKGFLEDKAYYATLNECDIFCMTRTNSKFANAGFPFKLGEFLASGKAVIATNIGDIPRYLKDKKSALIVRPDSVDDIAVAISYLIKEPSRIEKIGKEGKKVAEQHFDTRIWSEKLFKIFEEV